MIGLVASIPSPSTNVLEIGPLTIHFYGILIGIGVVVAAIIAQRRYERFGGDPAIVEKVVVWTVAIGFLGARLAYVSTHTGRFEGRWYAMFFIWEGGLALFGGLTVGAITAVTMVRRAGGDPWAFADAGAVGLPLAQAIVRRLDGAAVFSKIADEGMLLPPGGVLFELAAGEPARRLPELVAGYERDELAPVP